MRHTLEEIMCREVVVVGPWESVARAESLMREHRVGGLPVVEDGRIVGIITSRDVRFSHPNRLVADAMTPHPVTAPPELSLWEAQQLMEAHGVERLPVVRDGALLGVVTKAVLYAELGKHVDFLTGLSRSEYLLERAMWLLKSGREIVLLFFDLDDFGNLNKEFGHAVGDEVLRLAGELLGRAMPEKAYLCRYGGDEFAAVMEGSLEEAKSLASRVLEEFANASWPAGLAVQVSVGIAGGRRSGVRPEADLRAMVKELVNLASLACTRAKRLGIKVAVADGIRLVAD